MAPIDYTSVEQEIDGLGAASVGQGVLSTALPDASFSNDNDQQMGLSVLRVEIVVGDRAIGKRRRPKARSPSPSTLRA